MDMDSKQLTLILLGLLVGLLLIFGGCMVTKTTERVTNVPTEAPVEIAEEVSVEEEVVVEDEEEDTELKSIDEKIEERDVTPIGNRLWEDDEDEILFSDVEDAIELYADKTMSVDATEISVGDMLTWQNKDTFAHILLIEKDGVRVATGDRLEEGDSYSYTFEDKGEFLVRDMFSGTMRMIIIVD